jgi:pimeloyl-ACP methyl ester carboxylesterase
LTFAVQTEKMPRHPDGNRNGIDLKAIRGWVSPMLKIILLALIAYGLYCGFLFFAGRHVIFPRHYAGVPSGSENPPAGFERDWLEMPFGKVETWFLPPHSVGQNRPVPAVIFAHGNAELIDFSAYEMQPFSELGLAVLLVEYPGYGRSQGKPSQKTITETLCAAYDRLAARKDIDATKIVFYGRSVGGGAVCALAAERPSAALILVSTFTSIRSMAAKYLVPGFLVRDPFDNLATVKRYPSPILIIHGRHDEIIPFRHGERLQQAAPQSELIAYACGHNDCPPDVHQFQQDLTGFLQRVGIIPSGPPEMPTDKGPTGAAPRLHSNK